MKFLLRVKLFWSNMKEEYGRIPIKKHVWNGGIRTECVYTQVVNACGKMTFTTLDVRSHFCYLLNFQHESENKRKKRKREEFQKATECHKRAKVVSLGKNRRRKILCKGIMWRCAGKNKYKVIFWVVRGFKFFS